MNQAPSAAPVARPHDLRMRAVDCAPIESALPANEYVADAPDLVESGELLDRVSLALQASGYAGDTTPALLVYLALTSRLLPRPLNLMLHGSSASGKTHTVDSVLPMFPESAYYKVSAGSPKALIYLDEHLTHRTIIIAEADTLCHDDHVAASAIRALVTDNELAYDSVGKDEKGNNTTRRIRKPGPTGLITTGVRPLGDQLSTRVLEIPTPDDPEQTAAILRAQAARYEQGASVPVIDWSPFVEAQTWLETSGQRKVIIPFATALAELLSTNSPRMRRDFPQVLTVIHTVAMLRQRRRDCTDAGEIIARLEDYDTARALVGMAFTAVSVGVTPAIRRVIDALPESGSITTTKLADQLGLNKSTVSRHVSRAKELGFIVGIGDDDDETAPGGGFAAKVKGRVKGLRRGDVLPDEQLPTTRALQQRIEANRGDTG